jgi:superfamily II DNA/RNA helicase
MSFESFDLHPQILKAIADSGYTQPTPIQMQAIPDVMAGRDIMATAQTGTGKTAAFILPALQRISEPSKSRSRGPRVLVLTPTRELANQIGDAIERYGKYLRFRSGSIVGGMPFPPQYRLLSGGVDLLVATPGRLLDHIEQGRMDLSRLEVLVLDEADRMLDMGFIGDVQRIAKATPDTRQTLLFSATLDKRIVELAGHLLRDPKRIEVESQHTRHEQIEQRLHHVDGLDHKNRLLVHLLSSEEVEKAIVFTATKRDADNLADDLSDMGFKAGALHGDMGQGARNKTIDKLRRGAIQVLVATDVAARGIDINGISHVFNFDLPRAAEDYVHRIGRTGRAGAEGIAISFASRRDSFLVRDIERFTGQMITPHLVPGMEPSASFNDRGRGNGPSNGRSNAARQASSNANSRPYRVSNASTWERRVTDTRGGDTRTKSGAPKRSRSNGTRPYTRDSR